MLSKLAVVVTVARLASSDIVSFLSMFRLKCVVMVTSLFCKLVAEKSRKQQSIHQKWTVTDKIFIRDKQNVDRCFKVTNC